MILREKMMQKILLLVIGLMLAACAANLKSNPGQCVVTVGIVNSLSGGFAESGRDLQRGYEMARDEINARGEFSGCVLQLDTRDDQSDAVRAKDIAQQLSRESVVALIGAVNSDLTIAVAALTDDQRVPLIVPTASSDVLTAAFASTVRVAASQPQLVGTQFAFVENLRASSTPAKSVGLLYEESESGRGIFVAVKRAAQDHAIALIAAESYAQGATDWRDALARIQRAKPDVLYLDTNRLNDPVPLLRQVNDLGFKPSVTIVSAMNDTLLADARAENLVTSVQWLASLDWHDESGVTAAMWARDFEQRYHTSANIKSVAGYASVRLLARALKTQTLSATTLANLSSVRAALLHALYQVRADDTVFGPIRMDNLGQNQHPILIAQVIGGKLTIVYPEAYRARPLVVPTAE